MPPTQENNINITVSHNKHTTQTQTQRTQKEKRKTRLAVIQGLFFSSILFIHSAQFLGIFFFDSFSFTLSLLLFFFQCILIRICNIFSLCFFIILFCFEIYDYRFCFSEVFLCSALQLFV